MNTKRELAPLCVLLLAAVDHTILTSKRKDGRFHELLSAKLTAVAIRNIAQ